MTEKQINYLRKRADLSAKECTTATTDIDAGYRLGMLHGLEIALEEALGAVVASEEMMARRRRFPLMGAPAQTGDVAPAESEDL